MKLKKVMLLLFALCYSMISFGQQERESELEEQVSALLDSIVEQNKFTSALDSSAQPPHDNRGLL